MPEFSRAADCLARRDSSESLRYKPGVNNNNFLHRIRQIFGLNDATLVDIFAAADKQVSLDDVSAWLKRHDEPGANSLSDALLSSFLNGFINTRRGRRDASGARVETELNNNMLLRKLQIALDFKNADVLGALESGGGTLSEQGLKSLFRKRGHKNYRECSDGLLAQFLKGIESDYSKDSDSFELRPKV